MVNLLFIAPIGSIIALAFAGFLSMKILKSDEGTPAMKQIAQAVSEGAKAYLKRQYAGVAIFFGVMFVNDFLMT